MLETAGPYASDEFMWVIDGTVDVKDNQSGLSETVYAGEAFVIPRGYDCQWHQSGYVRKFYVISEHPNELIPSSPVSDSIIKPMLAIDETVALTKANVHLALLNNDNVMQKEQTCYQDSQARFFVGTWESEPFESALLPFSVNEFVYLQTGSLILIDEHNVEHAFTAGDAFFIPQGTICQWKVTEAIRTFYTVIKASKTD